jgi:hypothetical protein
MCCDATKVITLPPIEAHITKEKHVSKILTRTKMIEDEKKHDLLWPIAMRNNLTICLRKRPERAGTTSREDRRTGGTN